MIRGYFCTRALQRGALVRTFLSSIALCAALVCAGTGMAHAGITISGKPPTSVVGGSNYTFTPTVTDSNTGRTLTFAIANKPSWAYFNTTNGHITGTPYSAGTYSNIVISVKDGISSGTLPAFAVTVSPDPLKISGTPASTVSAGSSYSFTPTVTDSRTGYTRSFVIHGKPSWATFSSSTGKLSGTPTAANVGKYPYIWMQVYDGIGSAVLPSFTVTVLAATSTSSTDVVKISGTPPTSVKAGAPYSFKPTASDSAGRTLSFSVQNKPAWAAFSIASGLLSGTPSSAQTGTYSSIVISASDGQVSSALAPFNISVTSATATGQAILNWVPPTQNTNGTALTNLAGVRIYYGPSASSLSQLTQVAGTAAKSYTISNLSAGTWYFGAAAYTTTGVQSAMSSIVSKTVP